MLKSMLVLLFAAIPALFVLAHAVPWYYKATAIPVHASSAGVAVHATAPEPRLSAAAAEAERLARALVVGNNLPGLSVAVGVGDRLAWAAGFGWADVANEVAVTPRTRFRVGTLSTPLTAAAVGRLLERGSLDLDAPVQRYLPAFPREFARIAGAEDVPPMLLRLLRPAARSPATITTRQAMAHTAGFRHHQGEPDYLPRRRCDGMQQALDYFDDDPLLFEPGSAWRFSSYGWIVVSAVVEAVAGMPFAEFMQQQVFAPLGMHDTLPDVAGTDMPERALYYWPRAHRDTSYGLEHPTEVDYSCFVGAGFYLSTPSDLVRFGIAMDRDGLLEPATAALLQTPVVLPSGKPTGYGLGWFVQRSALGDAVGETTDPGVSPRAFRDAGAAGSDARTLKIGHPGIAVGATTTLRRYPELGIVVAVSSNVTFAELAPFAEHVAQVFAEASAARRAAVDDGSAPAQP